MGGLRGSWLVLATAVALWSGLLLGGAALAYRGDLRGYFLAGALFPHPPEFSGVPTQEGPGYDGQFFGALAVDPLLRRPETPGYLDLPGYRAGRIGLPLAAWMVALGNRPAALGVYLGLCWILGVLGVWVAARWLEDDGHSPWGALPLALSAGLVVSMLRGMPDAAAASLLLLALWLEPRDRPGAVPILALAALVRETSLIGAAGIAIVRWREGRHRAAAVAVLVPAAVTLGWRIYVQSRPGYPSFVPGEFGFPLAWLAGKLALPWRTDSIAEVVGMVAVALAALALALLLPRWRRWSAANWTYAGVVLLAFVLNDRIYEDRWAFARVTILLPLLAVPLAAAEERPAAATILRAVPLAYAVTGVLTLLLSTRLPALLFGYAGR